RGRAEDLRRLADRYLTEAHIDSRNSNRFALSDGIGECQRRAVGNDEGVASLGHSQLKRGGLRRGQPGKTEARESGKEQLRGAHLPASPSNQRGPPARNRQPLGEWE